MQQNTWNQAICRKKKTRNLILKLWGKGSLRAWCQHLVRAFLLGNNMVRKSKNADMGLSSSSYKEGGEPTFMISSNSL
jgi:hypothetical protein